MALFSKKTKKAESAKEASVKAVKAPKTPSSVGGRDFSWVLVKPRITEKATDVALKNTYVFDVSLRANKDDIKRAVAALYKVTPVKVSVAKVVSKSVRNMKTGVHGATVKGKKAYVYLKKGDTISLM